MVVFELVFELFKGMVGFELVFFFELFELLVIFEFVIFFELFKGVVVFEPFGRPSTFRINLNFFVLELKLSCGRSLSHGRLTKSSYYREYSGIKSSVNYVEIFCYKNSSTVKSKRLYICTTSLGEMQNTAALLNPLVVTSRPVAALCCCLLKALKVFTILPANVPPVNIPSAKLQFLHNNNFFFFASCPSQLTNSPRLFKKQLRRDHAA